jgi:putative transposase
MRRTLAKLGILPATFYRWYDRYRSGGPEALERPIAETETDLEPHSGRIRERIVQLALDEPELSPRELATRFTDAEAISSRRHRSIARSGRMTSSPARPTS